MRRLYELPDFKFVQYSYRSLAIFLKGFNPQIDSIFEQLPGDQSRPRFLIRVILRHPDCPIELLDVLHLRSLYYSECHILCDADKPMIRDGFSVLIANYSIRNVHIAIFSE